LKPAAELGMTTILVSSHHDWAQPTGDEDYIHYATDKLADWLAAIATAASKTGNTTMGNTTGNQKTGS